MGNRKRVPAVAGGLGAIILLGLAANFAIGHQGREHRSHGAKNVILLIGDGMGVSEVTAARYYHYGAAGRVQMDRFPNTG